MKVAIIFLAVLPVILSMSVKEHEVLDNLRKMSHEERISVHDAYEKVKNWLTSNGKAISAASCSVVCASATALETMGLSAPVCVAACGLYVDWKNRKIYDRDNKFIVWSECTRDNVCMEKLWKTT